MCKLTMTLDTYTRIKVIGKGSYGEVWLGRHKRDKKLYVLKRMDLQKATKRERGAAEQEAKLLSKLRHPNIVSYKDSFETDNGFLYITMQYCEGGDLYTKLKAQKGELLEQRQVVEWFVQIAMALQYMHERNILHRDLKTQNIFLTKSKIIKVGDLGIARVLDSTNDMATTLIGTPYYMSPELFSNKPYNHKSDVWALGCCVYEMTTLKHAFNAKDMNSLVYKILRGKMPAMPKQYDTDLVSLIKSMLHQDPDKRPSVNRILRHAFIKRNIQIFLEGTKARQRASSAGSVSSITSDQSNVSIPSESSNQNLTESGAGDAQISNLEPITENEKTIENKTDRTNESTLKNPSDSGKENLKSEIETESVKSEEIIQKSKTENETKITNNDKNNRNVTYLKYDNISDSGVLNKSDKSDISSHSNKSESGSKPDSNIYQALPNRPDISYKSNKSDNSPAVETDNKSNVGDLNKQSSDSSVLSGVSKRSARRQRKHVTEADTSSSTDSIRSARSHKVKLVSRQRPLPPPPKVEETNGVPLKRDIVIRQEESSAPNVPQGVERETKSSGSSKSSSTTSSQEHGDSVSDDVQRSQPNRSARERRRRQIESSISASQERPNSARLKLVRPSSAKITAAEKREQAVKVQKEPIYKSHKRQPSLADESSSSAEETEKPPQPEEKIYVKREKRQREMSEFLSVLDTTLKNNREDDGNQSDDEKRGHVIPVVMDDMPVIINRRLNALRPSSMPSEDTLGSTDRLMSRIRLLRRDCKLGIGDTRLRQAFEILEKFEDDKIEPKLVDLMGKENYDNYAGKIWQLKFCEDSAFPR